MKIATRRRIVTAVLASCYASLPSPVAAQAVDAAGFVPAPPGTQVAMLYLQYGHAGSQYSDGTKVADVDISRVTTIARYIRYGDVGGLTYNLQLLQPFGYARGDGVSKALGTASGLGDTIVTGQLFLVNHPQSRTFFAVQPYLFVPTGSYDESRRLNIGENRWRATIQAGLSKGWNAHLVTELLADAEFFGSNKDFAGHRRLESEPLYRVQAYGRYIINPANEANVRIGYAVGGQTTLDGVSRHDPARTTSALATWRHNLSPRWNLLTQAGTDLGAHNGLREDARVQMRLTHVF